ncbi:MAG: PAS domain-containing protein [Kiloniellaceae bacterium]
MDEVDLSGDLFVAAHDHWTRLRGAERAMPRREDLDPLDTPPRLLAYSELVEVLQDPLDFRYRLIGTEIDRISRRSYTGLTVRQIPSQSPPSRMFDFFALAFQRRSPLCARLPYEGPDGDVESIRNLLLPLGADGREVSFFWSVVEIERRRA